MALKLIIQGKPSSGKTTLIKEIISKIKYDWAGFYTEEIRKNGRRIGFKLVNMKREEAIFAHQDFKSDYKVSKYGVDLSVLERYGIDVVKSYSSPKLIIIDEIGKMELFSQKFRDFIAQIFDSDHNILATMKVNPDQFCRMLLERPDVKVFNLSRNNFQEVKVKILKLLSSL
jgi:nucleoside-triphosphatase